ncbi:MAG: dynamin family protein, partial [Gammaproteobacteria bacterium]|nr:dynamin family protein [Gammaproteobacteria bacterium]
MKNKSFFDDINAYGKWKNNLISTINFFQEWLIDNKLDESDHSIKIYEILKILKHDRITLAFVGEFSRGKTELINAIFFSQFKRRLLPSEAGRTTMCPTELFYDIDAPTPYIRLLPIETRIEDISITEHKENMSNWTNIDLEIQSPNKMADAFSQITAVKRVKAKEARRLGLYDVITDADNKEISADHVVEIPQWRHALINFPHPFLEQGMAILDTPGLNSLGNEPELTINMLPNAQAAIFVLAADTGVTRSDMEIWRKHLKSFRRNRNNGLIIALNKIDTLWDDLKTPAEVQQSIHRQCMETAKTLKVDKKRVIAISAQKGLIGRVKDDTALVTASNLDKLEQLLSTEILPQKEQLVRNTLIADVNSMMQESKNILVMKFNNKKRSVEQFSSASGKNEGVITNLLKKTRQEQAIYQHNSKNLQSSNKILLEQHERLINMINLDRLDQKINESRNVMSGSWTTTGMKKAMKILFEGISHTMDESTKQTELTNRLVTSIYKRFQSENEEMNISPKLFSIISYRQEIEALYQDAEEYRTGMYSTMTEQSFVIKKFFISMVSRARNIYYQLNKDANDWSKRALTPLVRQVKSHKNELQLRMGQLKKAGQSRDSITHRVDEIKFEAVSLQKQIGTINKMMTLINTPMPTIVHSNKANKKAGTIKKKV